MSNMSLPIDDFLSDIQEALKKTNNVILQAAPGAGKSTRVPAALMDEIEKEILVLEPRRLAARLCAERVAFEHQEKCGQRIGFQIRYERKESAQTRVKYITEGLFLRLFLADPTLSKIGCVILDEFHERHIHTDVTLMLVKYLQQTSRPDLKLIVMSATIDTQKLDRYLVNAQTFICPGKVYPVDIFYAPHHEQNRSLESKVYLAVSETLKSNQHHGNILVFLPGAFEIRKCAEILSDLQEKHPIVIYELRADLAYEKQQKVFEPSEKIKVILSTNVAETSLTIEDVTVVIDSGLAKIATYDGWNGLSQLEVKAISQAACVQRAGRAGRTQKGVARRLFSQMDFHGRAAFEIPEIHRLDLAQSLLEIKNLPALSDVPILELPWFEAPEPNRLEAACTLLRNLGGFDENNHLTSIGRALCQYPLHPRLSRVLYEAARKNVLPQGILMVSLISEGMAFHKAAEALDVSHSDVKYQLDLLCDFFQEKEMPYSKKKLIDTVQAKKIENLARYLCQLSSVSWKACFQNLSDQDMSVLLLSGFSDRIAKKRSSETTTKKREDSEFNLCLGGSATLSKQTMVQQDDLVIAIEANQTVGQLIKTQLKVCHAVDPSELAQRCPSWLQQQKAIFWDADKKSAKAINQILYGKIVLSEQPLTGHSQELEKLLTKQLTEAWPKPFDDDMALQYLKIRSKLAENQGIFIEMPTFEGIEFDYLMQHICEGKKSFSEILKKNLNQYIEDLIAPDQIAMLNSLFPTGMVMGKNRKVQIHYQEDKPPFIQVRLQDLFGLTETPKICHQKVSLVVHLLAPNMQVIQVTNDLMGFWKRDYPQVRKELSRRYPRHKWPEDPTQSISYVK